MYCTVGDVRRLCSSISENDAPDSEIEILILEAQDEIDTQLGEEYDTPFESVPTKIARMCADLAAYFLMRTYPDKVFHDDKDEIRTNYDRAIRELRTGVVGLVGQSRSSTSTAGPHFVVTNTTNARWSLDRTTDYGEL